MVGDVLIRKFIPSPLHLTHTLSSLTISFTLFRLSPLYIHTISVLQPFVTNSQLMLHAKRRSERNEKGPNVSVENSKQNVCRNNATQCRARRSASRGSWM